MRERCAPSGALNTFTKLVPEKHRKLLNVPFSPVGAYPAARFRTHHASTSVLTLATLVRS